MKTDSGTVATASVGTLNVTRKWTLTDDLETPLRGIRASNRYTKATSVLHKLFHLSCIRSSDTHAINILIIA